MTATKARRPQSTRHRTSSSKGTSVYPIDRRVSKTVGPAYRSERGRSGSYGSVIVKSHGSYGVKAHAAPTTQVRPVSPGKMLGRRRLMDVYMPKDPIVVQAEALLGPTLTQYILDQSSKHDIVPFGLQHYHLVDPGSPVADAIRIAEMLAKAEDKTTIQAWFAGKNRFLGGRAPATVIVTDLAAVRRAARRFLAQG